MNYLIDTNVISELVSAKPHSRVIQWFDDIPAGNIFLSVLTLGEIRKGVEKVKDKQRKMKLLTWLEHDLATMFNKRILPISLEVADRWGRLQAQVAQPFPAIDCLLAATALHHDMALVTRNVDDFSSAPGLEIINPWDA